MSWRTVDAWHHVAEVEFLIRGQEATCDGTASGDLSILEMQRQSPQTESSVKWNWPVSMRGAMEADSDRDGEVELLKLFGAQMILSEFQILGTRLFKLLKFWFCIVFIVPIEDNIKPERITKNFFGQLPPPPSIWKMRYIIPILTRQSQKNYKFFYYSHIQNVKFQVNWVAYNQGDRTRVWKPGPKDRKKRYPRWQEKFS